MANKRIIKRLLIIFGIIVLLISGVIVWLNNFYLPRKVKSLIVDGVEEATGKRASLDSVKINIFKGLVLRNLIIYDDDKPLIAVKEISSSIIIPELFNKKIIIPVINLEYPTFFIKRGQDGSFNIAKLFSNPASEGKEKKSKGFGVAVFKIDIDNGYINFEDSTFETPFSAMLENVGLNIYPTLPANIRFTLKARYHSDSPVFLSAVGGYDILQKKFLGKASFKGLCPKDFAPYYKNLGFSSSAGSMDGLINLQFAQGAFSTELSAKSQNLVLNKGKILVRLNSEIRALASYAPQDKVMTFSGKAVLSDSQVKGLAVADNIKGIAGDVSFNNSGIWSDNLSGLFLQAPVRAAVKFMDFKNPSFSVNASSAMGLEESVSILRDKLRFNLPGQLKGKGNLTLLLDNSATQGGLAYSGHFELIDGVFNPDKIKYPLENINGRVEFGPNQLKWQDLNFKFLGVPYKSSGTLTDFAMPGVQLGITSPELSLQSLFLVNKKVVNISKLSGKYLGSDFSIQGTLDAGSPKGLKAVLSGGADIELTDIRPLFPKLEEKLKKADPRGKIHIVADLDGDILDLKSCLINAKFSSPEVSAFGLKSQEFFLNSALSGGFVEAPFMHVSCYGGKIDGSASLDLGKEGYPYEASLAIDSIQIDKLKEDTPVKDKDISGIIKVEAKLNGAVNDISKLNGSGSIYISEGKLWELNLFKGLGALVFAKDFAKIVFQEGSCSFIVQDKAISTQDLRLKSSVADLAGPVKIGFDGTLDASLNVEVISEMVPLTGTFKDITTAIIGNATKFGVIKLSGTVREPKYKFNTAVVDILKGLRDTIFGN